MSKPVFPQALASSLAYRLAHAQNALFASLATSRASKRQATAKVNYAEDYNELDFDFDDAAAGAGAGAGVGVGEAAAGAGNDDPLYFDGIGGADYAAAESSAAANSADAGAANGTTTDLPHDSDAAVSEDPHAAYDVYRNIILNSNTHSTINLANLQGTREAPKTPATLLANATPQEIITNASLEYTVIPLKVKIDANGASINDFCLWNIEESLITPEIYASTLAQDLDLNKSTEALIAASIKDQIQQYRELFTNPNNAIVDQFLANQKELHVVLDIATNIGEDFYTDKIEWDILDKTTTPEMFARTVVQDVGLRPEFETAIACSLYDEIYKFKRELLENPQQLSQNIDSLPFFNLINKDDLEIGTWQGVRFDPRKYGEEFSPSVEKLSPWEIEKRETEKERNLRRRKRETMRVAGGLVR